MFLTTGKMVKVAEEMNRLTEEIDAALCPEVRADDLLQGPLHNHLNSMQRMLRPLR